MNIASTRFALAVLCVLMVSAGQLMFRQTGLAIERKGGWFDPGVLLLLGVALLTYGAATLVWINLLRTVPLSVAYPVMGLSFVFVPLLGGLVFREAISVQQMAGALLILAGITVSHFQS